MFGNMAQSGGFELPKQKSSRPTGRRRTQISGQPQNIPGGRKPETMGDLNVWHSRKVTTGGTYRNHTMPRVPCWRDPPWIKPQAQLRSSFLKIFLNSSQMCAMAQAVIEFYHDPTLTIGPAIMPPILNRFSRQHVQASASPSTYFWMSVSSRSGVTIAGGPAYMHESQAVNETQKLPSAVRAPAGAKSTGKKQKCVVGYRGFDHGWHDDLLRLLHRHIQAQSIPGRGRTHAARVCSPTYTPGNHPHRQIAICICNVAVQSPCCLS